MTTGFECSWLEWVSFTQACSLYQVNKDTSPLPIGQEISIYGRRETKKLCWQVIKKLLYFIQGIGNPITCN